MAYAIYIYVLVDVGVADDMVPKDVTIPRCIVLTQSFRGFAHYIVPAIIFTTRFRLHL